MNNEQRKERDQKFIEMYKSGNTLFEIGIQFGITRERVRQRLNANGITGINGGASVKAASRTALREKANLERLDRRSIAIYGCTRNEMKDERAKLTANENKNLERIYQQSRKKAQRSAIPWEITFPQFALLMKADCGFYGRGKLNKVFRLVDPTKPYTIDNVAVMTHSQSSVLARVKDKTKLTPTQGRIMRLYDAGHTPMEIAKRLGKNVETVKGQIHMAKNRFRHIEQTVTE
jgi:DNA-binding CsgD family transcriptional regulator